MKLQNVVLVALVAILTVACGKTEQTPLQLAEQEAERVQSQRQAAALNNRTIALEVPCGDIVDIAFNPYDGRARFWTGIDPDKKIHCYNSFGFNRWTGDKLEAVTPEVVNEIRKNPGCYPKTPACTQCNQPAAVVTPPQPPPPPPAVSTTPLPELGQGYCCGRQR